MSTAPAAASSANARFFKSHLSETDPEVFSAIQKEFGRQQHEIELIASENIVSQAVLDAAGSVLTNKYAEGYPGKRYYGGCQYVDIAEQLAIDRAKQLFGCGFANVQPNSGSQANQGIDRVVTTKIRSARPRKINSEVISPASSVLPRPTSSAISSLTRSWASARSTGRCWNARSSIAALPSVSGLGPDGGAERKAASRNSFVSVKPFDSSG